MICKRVGDCFRIQGVKGLVVPVKGKPVRTSEKYLESWTPFSRLFGRRTNNVNESLDILI